MIEHKFITSDMQEKSAYVLERKEFDTVLVNLERVGDLSRRAIVKANDPRSGMRPRIPSNKDKVDLLHEVLGDDQDVSIEMTPLDILRFDRAEIAEALRHSHQSGLSRKVGQVVLGLPTMAMVFDDLRPAILRSSVDLEQPELITDMMDQFYAEGAQRVISSVQEA